MAGRKKKETESVFLEGETKSGFKYKIEKETLDDVELFESILELQEGNMLNLGKVLNGILGENQKKALYDHVRNDKGRVSFTPLSVELTDILTGNAETKNS